MSIFSVSSFFSIKKSLVCICPESRFSLRSSNSFLCPNFLFANSSEKNLSTSKNPQKRSERALLRVLLSAFAETATAGEVAGASPEIMVMPEVVNGLHILKHIEERIRNIFVFLSLPHSLSHFPVPFTAGLQHHSSG